MEVLTNKMLKINEQVTKRDQEITLLKQNERSLEQKKKDQSKLYDKQEESWKKKYRIEKEIYDEKVK